MHDHTASARPSAAQRVGPDPAYPDYHDDDLYTTDSKPAPNPQPGPVRQNTKLHRTREPQAALYVPSPRTYTMAQDWTGPHVFQPDMSRPDAPKKVPPTLAARPNKTSAVQDRSPLQLLEGKLGGLSKEEKRARAEAAEGRLQQAGGDGLRRNVSEAAPPRAVAQDGGRQRRHQSDGARHVDQNAKERGGGYADAGRATQSQPSRAQQYLTPAANTAATVDGSTRKVNAEHEPRRDSREGPANQQISRESSRRNEQVGRSDSGRLQKRNGQNGQSLRNRNPQNGLSRPAPTGSAGPTADVVPTSAVKISNSKGPSYQIPPQTLGSVEARQKVNSTFASESRQPPNGNRQQAYGRPRPINNLPPFRADEFRSGAVVKLELDDLALDDAITRSKSSRNSHEESDSAPRNSKRRASTAPRSPAENSQGYQPELYVRCGPLLRYTGLRREKKLQRDQRGTVEREIWRGSVMIVTADGHSSYSTPPTLRLFAQPMDLLPPLSPDHREELPADYVDPVAGQVRPDQKGRSRYVKPVELIPEGVDLSLDYSNQGLYETEPSSPIKSRLKPNDGEKVGRFREVQAARLHVERGLTFWRFNIEVELGLSQARIAYRINGGPATGFWVPARGATMNIMFHSCNGFSQSVDPNDFSGPDPLWRDVLNGHSLKPFHVMIGGGDQLYNDRVMRDAELFAEWLQIKNPERKHHAEFSREMQNELECFYLNRYALWFSQGLFGLANSQIPMVNLWDDHDIIDGYGSYPHHLMSSKVFTGLGTVAFKYYMLFQHQSVPLETFHDEPSWVLGASPGPYIHYQSRNVFLFLGRKVAFLGLDCRTERTRDEILCQSTYDQLFNRCRAEIVRGETKHLIVLLTVPIAYPRLNFLENILTSRVMDPIKAIGRTGALGGFVNKFDGGVEILDDLDDHWTAKHHKQERNWFIQELQELAAEKSIRVTILGGDVHLGAIGQFYSNKAYGISKDKDHRYMPNVISSAIVNAPSPAMMSDILNRRNKVHHLDHDTDEDMIAIFTHDVDGKKRNNKTLLPRRNYCTIKEYVPGSTPVQSPSEEDPPTPDEQDELDRRKYPPGSMSRSKSMGAGESGPKRLLRRLSGSGSRAEEREVVPRRFSFSTTPRRSEDAAESYFPQGATAAKDDTDRPTGTFRRRLTAPSQTTRQESYNANEEEYQEHPDDINLEGGLDITLNMEISQHDPSGSTVPYRLLVPALSHTGGPDPNTTRSRGRRASIIDRLRRGASLRRDRDRSASTDGSRSPGPEHVARADGHRATRPDDRPRFADARADERPVAVEEAAGAAPKDERRDSRYASADEEQRAAARGGRVGGGGEQRGPQAGREVGGDGQRVPQAGRQISGEDQRKSQAGRHVGGEEQRVLQAGRQTNSAEQRRPLEGRDMHTELDTNAQLPRRVGLPQEQFQHPHTDEVFDDDDDDDDNDNEAYGSRPQRRRGFLGSLKRRFSRRGRRDDDSHSGDSASDNDNDDDGREQRHAGPAPGDRLYFHDGGAQQTPRAPEPPVTNAAAAAPPRATEADAARKGRVSFADDRLGPTGRQHPLNAAPQGQGGDAAHSDDDGSYTSDEDASEPPRRTGLRGGLDKARRLLGGDGRYDERWERGGYEDGDGREEGGEEYTDEDGDEDGEYARPERRRSWLPWRR